MSLQADLLDTKVITDSVRPFTDLFSTILVNATRVWTGSPSHELIHVVLPHCHAQVVDCRVAVGFLLLEQGCDVVSKLVLFRVLSHCIYAHGVIV